MRYINGSTIYLNKKLECTPVTGQISSKEPDKGFQAFGLIETSSQTHPEACSPGMNVNFFWLYTCSMK